MKKLTKLTALALALALVLGMTAMAGSIVMTDDFSDASDLSIATFIKKETRKTVKLEVKKAVDMSLFTLGDKFQHNTKPIFILAHVPNLYTQTDFYIASEPIFPFFTPCGSSLCKLCCVAPTGGLLNHKKIRNKNRSCKLVGRACKIQSRFLTNTCIREPILYRHFTTLRRFSEKFLQKFTDFYKKHLYF